jgi:DNA polymerase III delta prime subunit
MEKKRVHDYVQKKIDGFLQTKNIPHIIFHGSSGTGKRTIVLDFINRIYQYDKYKIKTNVMFVNCAHGKGIKFIREELKFFAKTNIQSNSGVLFKSIVLFNADFLTMDAQSALRRCIELFSYNTRFFIIVDNKEKLLNPILSRFCVIYVPEYMENGKIVNLHEYNLRRIDFESQETVKQTFLQMKMDELFTLKTRDSRDFIKSVTEVTDELYENAISACDLMDYVERSNNLFDKTNELFMDFHHVKSEFRSEKLLLFYLLQKMF